MTYKGFSMMLMNGCVVVYNEDIGVEVTLEGGIDEAQAFIDRVAK